MATVGTGPSKNCSWRRKPLLPSHCYPIIGKRFVYWFGEAHCHVDVVEGTEGPFVTILDTWKDGSNDGHLSKSSMWTLDSSAWWSSVAGHLLMSWSDVLSTFDGVYLSWNPEIWPNNVRFHGWVVDIRILSWSKLDFRTWKRRGQDEQCTKFMAYHASYEWHGFG